MLTIATNTYDMIGNIMWYRIISPDIWFEYTESKWHKFERKIWRRGSDVGMHCQHDKKKSNDSLALDIY